MAVVNFRKDNVEVEHLHSAFSVSYYRGIVRRIFSDKHLRLETMPVVIPKMRIDPEDTKPIKFSMDDAEAYKVRVLEFGSQREAENIRDIARPNEVLKTRMTRNTDKLIEEELAELVDTLYNKTLFGKFVRAY